MIEDYYVIYTDTSPSRYCFRGTAAEVYNWMCVHNALDDPEYLIHDVRNLVMTSAQLFILEFESSFQDNFEQPTLADIRRVIREELNRTSKN